MFREAQALLQRAVDIDCGREEGEINLPDELIEAGVLQLHRAFYDSGLAGHSEIIEIIKQGGQTEALIWCLAHLREGEYKLETLKQMYGLGEE